MGLVFAHLQAVPGAGALPMVGGVRRACSVLEAPKRRARRAHGAVRDCRVVTLDNAVNSILPLNFQELKA